ncbi:MerR family transcriptional regulator [Streptomyces triticagri]|uniref:MerR family transcriptional regulator n=1 Tax=Streptomyces triticagri TaxID=2293568 RepID=A0A372M0K7_9ACTN|nr:MerR family transcriptional regulator [Streptomyces triticagri]RFU84359.1 MerR family transcriptional regulator [Streptomyces triticagri]
MPNTELMPIGVFARRTGLTASALRFYADSGLLPPAEVDPDSGYRYYAASQVARAAALRQLREIGMPLPAVDAVLDADPGEASRLVDDHVAQVLADAAAVRQKAASIKSALTDGPSLPVATLTGPVLADAIEQVLTATAHEPGLPVLGAVRIEATQEAVTLTATDRYRLATRTLVPAGTEATGAAWAATVDGDELRSAVPEIRRSALVRIEASPHAVRLRMPDREDRHCRLLPQEFPDHRSMLDSLPEPGTRTTVAKDLLLRALEEHSGERITLHITRHALTVEVTEGAGVTGAAPVGTPLPATVTGQDLRITFALTTLYPAVSTAIGPDVMLDLRGPDQPVTIRSADRGDLTTLAMPVDPTHTS